MATVLVVDDDSVSRRLLSAQLRKGGYTVFSIERENTPLGWTAKVRCDLAILDIVQADRDGLDLLRALRSDPDYEVIPIIMLAASGRIGDGIKARAHGAHAFLPKPVRTSELLDVVSRALRLQ